MTGYCKRWGSSSEGLGRAKELSRYAVKRVGLKLEVGGLQDTSNKSN